MYERSWEKLQELAMSAARYYQCSEFDCEDIASDIALKVHEKNITQWNSTFVYKCVKNEVINRKRKEKTRKYKPVYEKWMFYVPEIEYLDDVLAEIRGLRGFEIFEKFVHGYKYKELAELYNIDIEAVKGRIWRFRKKAIKKLEKI